jgi:hypothetical protein
MDREVAIRPVAAKTRIVFPQTSAHRALYGLRENREAGQVGKVPASMAACLGGNSLLPASEFLQGRLASKDTKGSSQVRCCWG